MSQYRDSYNNSFALVIGINTYSDPQFATLGKAEQDAQNIANLLIASPYSFDVTTLLGKDATRDAIETALFQLRATLPDDRILVYFAGHGYTLVDEFKQETGYLAAVDTVPQKDYTALDLDGFTSGLIRHAKAKHIAFIFDACFSGQALGLTRAGGDISAGKFLERRAFQVISAGAGDQTVSDARSMTGTLIDALKQGIANEDGLVTLSEIGLYLQRTISADSGQTQIPQFGHLRGSQGGEFVFYEDTSLRLPNEIQAALASSREAIREGGVEALVQIAHGDDADLAKLARERLDVIAREDPSKRVRTAALGMPSGVPSTDETIRHDPSQLRPIASGVKPPPPPGHHHASETKTSIKTDALPRKGKKTNRFGLPPFAMWGVAGVVILLGLGAMVCLAGVLFPSARPGDTTPTPDLSIVEGPTDAVTPNVTDEPTAPPDEQGPIKAAIKTALELAYSLKVSSLHDVTTKGLEQAYTATALNDRISTVNLAKKDHCNWNVSLDRPDVLSYQYIGETSAFVIADRVESRTHYCKGKVDPDNTIAHDHVSLRFYLVLKNDKWLVAASDFTDLPDQSN